MVSALLYLCSLLPCALSGLSITEGCNSNKWISTRRSEKLMNRLYTRGMRVSRVQIPINSFITVLVWGSSTVPCQSVWLEKWRVDIYGNEVRPQWEALPLEIELKWLPFLLLVRSSLSNKETTQTIYLQNDQQELLHILDSFSKQYDGQGCTWTWSHRETRVQTQVQVHVS